MSRRRSSRLSAIMVDVGLWIIVAGFVAAVLAAFTDGSWGLPEDEFQRAVTFFAIIIVARYVVRRLIYHDGRVRVKTSVGNDNITPKRTENSGQGQTKQ